MCDHLYRLIGSGLRWTFVSIWSDEIKGEQRTSYRERERDRERERERKEETAK